MNSLSRTEQYSGRQRRPLTVQLHNPPDPFTIAVWAIAAVVTPAIAVMIVLRRRRVRWTIPAASAVTAVGVAGWVGHPLWALLAPIGGWLTGAARLLSGSWPTWTVPALGAWITAGLVVGVALASVSGWHRRRYTPTFDDRPVVTEDALAEAVTAARWAPLDPQRMTLGVDVDTLAPVVVSRDALARHALLLGESGTGKTVVIVQLIDWFVTGPVRR